MYHWLVATRSDAMEFRILGPVEVWHGGRSIDLGPPKQRALIAKLLVHPNQVVSVDQLVDTLWEAEAPETARALVHTYVCRLRRALRSADGGRADDVLRTRPPGYVLRVEPDQLDLDRFQSLVAEAAAATARGDHACAARLLRSALALWRGEALANVVSARRRSMVVQLEESRLVALEARIDADMRLARHRDLVGELRTLVAEYPSRECLHGQLMLALYRSGRRADALAAYRRLHRGMTAEYGVEPGVQLRHLHRAILTADPSLDLADPGPQTPATASAPPDGPAATDACPPAVRPSQVPPTTASFTGRADEMTHLQRLLGQVPAGAPPVVVAIDGLPGIGKSALAARMAHRLADRFPDGHLYVDLRGAEGTAPLAPTDVLGRFLRSFGVGDRHLPSEPEERAGLLRSLMTGRRVLTLLDNAANAAQIQLLLPAGPGCAALVTSRRQLTDLDAAAHLHLDVLPAPDAEALLARLTSAERIAAERTEAAEVAQLCGCLPLALRIAGARLAARPAWPVSRLAERLRDEHLRLDELEIDGLAVRASLHVAYRELSGRGTQGADLASALRLLSLWDGADIGTTLAAAMLDRPTRAAEAALEKLVDANLMDSSAPGRYRFHDLVRLFARERASRQDTEPDRVAALNRAVRCYLTVARHADQMLRPGQTRAGEPHDGHIEVRNGHVEFRTDTEALDWLEAERANLVAATASAAAGPQYAPAWQLAAALFAFFDMRGSWDEWEQVNMLALQAARCGGDHPGEAHTRRNLGAIAWRRGRLAEATDHLTRSLTLCSQVGDRHGEARTLNSLGLVLTAQRRYDDATSCLERSLTLFRQCGDRRGLGHVANNLGDLYRLQGRHDEAVARLRQDLQICHELGDRRGAAITLYNLGEVEHDRGCAAAASDYHSQSLAICRELGDRRGEGRNLDRLGEARRLQGRHQEAVELLRQAVTQLVETRDRLAEADALQHLGLARHALGDHSEADICLRHALSIFEQVDAPQAADVRVHLSAPHGNDPAHEAS
jgi:DNA-binding SARP family transcriptional activator/tetratricopeptide (TPR) repeat protein